MSLKTVPVEHMSIKKIMIKLGSVYGDSYW